MLVMLAPDGRVMVTVQRLTGVDPAVTRTVATKPPVHWLIDAVATQPPPVGGGVVGGGVVGGGSVGGGVVGGGVVGGGVAGPSARTGVCQSRQSANRPSALLEIRITPGSFPVFNRNFRMLFCRGPRHSGRLAQWVPSWTSDQ
jgi:hypothetical protein